MKKVYGSFLTSTEARKAVDELLQEGYIKEEIKVVSKEDLKNNLSYTENDIEKDDTSLWEKIKDLFNFDHYSGDYWDKDLEGHERKLLEAHKINLDAGHIIVLIEEGAKAYRETFRNGVPDWDEREEEFNED